MKTLITKRCGNCMAEFQSEPHYHKLYCSHTCYQRAKVQRRVAKDNVVKLQPKAADASYIWELTFPTKEQLDAGSPYVTTERPGKIIGLNHQYETLPDRELVKQQKLQPSDPDVWILTPKTIDIIAELLKAK